MAAMLALVILGAAPRTGPAPDALEAAQASAPPAGSPPIATAGRAGGGARTAPARAQEIRALWVLRGSLTRPERIDRLVQSA